MQRDRASPVSANQAPSEYWCQSGSSLLAWLYSRRNGLTSAEAAERLRRYGPNRLKSSQQKAAVRLLLNQFTSPRVLILIGAAAFSAAVREWVDALIAIAIVVGSALLGFLQEYSATTVVEKLRAQVRVRAGVLRDGQSVPVPAAEVVPGDVMRLSAGSLVPADAVVLEARDFFVNQAVLTGETFPVEKTAQATVATASLAERSNAIYMGTNVRSGTALALVVQTGTATAFGQIAQRLTLRPPETEFEHGIRRFGYLLTQVMLALVLTVFAINVFAARPPIDSFLFAIALAVGVAPELLPAVISLNVAKGAQHMARHGVIVRTLSAIENLGSMNILCTDKTGTITAGVVHLDRAYDACGQPSAAVLHAAYLNAAWQTGPANALDDASLAAAA